MKQFFTLLILSFVYTCVFAQPPNDNCDNATNIGLNAPSGCPVGGSANTVITGTNIDATPATPYPTFSGCNPGGSTNGPAAEVWFSFVATANTNSFTITGGLSTPNVVIFTGGNCQFLTAIACARGMAGTGVVTLSDVTLTPGQTYFILISGGDVNDQGTFTLTVQAENDCSLCTSANGQTVTVNPPPANGTYASGTQVQFCYTLSEWDLTGTVEWFHGIQITLGSGWDEFSLIPDWANTTASACPANPGNWVWSTGWVGCNTSNFYGPGFAYDGTTTSVPLPCPMSPIDGDPGNNWGYGGGGCEVITPATALTFCWYVNVQECPPNDNGADLSIYIEPLSDGESGSWNQIGCNSGVSYDFLASGTCCDDPDPLAFSTPTSCPGTADGTITYEGGAGAVSGPWNYTVFNSAGSVIYQSSGIPGPETLGGLPSGMYNVLAINALSGCSRSTFVTVDDGFPPMAIATANMPCPGGPIQLMGDVIPGGSTVEYLWTAPSGATFTSQNPLVNQEGEYTLVVTVDGCPSPETSVIASYIPVFTTAQANPTELCTGDVITLSATGGDIYDWGPAGFGQTVSVVAPNVLGTETITFTVNITTSDGCPATEMVDVVVHQIPEIEIIAPLEACEGSTVTLNALGGVDFLWNTTQTGPLISAMMGVGPIEEFSVTVTDQFGCVGEDNHFINVNSLPTVTATATPDVICAGDEVTLSATGGDFYDWQGESVGQTITVNPTMATIYDVIVTDANGCQNTGSVSVSVETPISAPIVSCGEMTPESVTFNWEPVPNATGYDVTVDVGPMGILNDTSYTVMGLNPGESVTITVAALSPNSCPDVSTQMTCSSQNCPIVNVVASGVSTYCLNGNNGLDTLVATISTPAMDGDTVWSGPGIIDTLLGVFDPVLADTGSHNIILTYTEGDCSYTDTLTIDIFNVPNADFVLGTDTICISDTLLITYTGSADTSASYVWNFNGGNADPATGQGPQEVNWTTSGDKIIALTVTENGCTSQTFTDTVTVLNPLSLPIISCGAATTTSVLFTWEEVLGASGYTVNVLTGQIGTLDSTSFLVEGLLPEDSVTIEVTVIDDGPCSDVSATFTCFADPCPDFLITIGAVSDICLDANTSLDTLSVNVNGGDGNGDGTWSGSGIIDDTLGVFDPSIAGAGVHPIVYTYVEGPCMGNDTLDITIFDVPTADFTISEITACINDTVVINYTGTADTSMANFIWNFNGGQTDPGTGAGPHQVSWASGGTKIVSLIVEENGCTSVQDTLSIMIESPLPPPVINCATTTSTIEFTWVDVPGAVNYVVTVLQGNSGVQSGNSYLVTGLSPGDIVEIEVEAIGTGPCGNSTASLSCIAEDCPMVSISIDSIAPICLDASAMPFTLSVTLAGDNGLGTGTWMGIGITDTIAGTFDPNIAGVGVPTVSYTYQEGNCIYSDSRTITINEQPTATFTVDDSICINQSSTIIYTGSVSGTADYNWDFGDGIAMPGTGAGPHEVSWTSGGDKTISLIVTANDCASEVFEQMVFVDTLLSAPIINCNPTTSTIEFSWTTVSGAIDYQVTVLQGPSGTQTGNTYLVENLSPGDIAEIQIEAIGTGPCGSSIASLSCIAEDCPIVSISIDSIAPICLDASAMPFTLSVTLAGDNGMGIGTWTGTGVTDMMLGTFDPNTAGVGSPVVTYLYEEGNCSYNASRTIVINEQPTATFSVDDSICINQTSTVIYTGTVSGAADFTWDFGDGDAMPGAGQGPHEVSWTSGGDKNISLIVTANDCASELVEQNVFVDTLLAPPVISCSSTTSTIEFTWTTIPGAVDYVVTVLQGPSGTQAGNTYLVENLDPGEIVEIQVEAVGIGACGSSMSNLTCAADDCPMIVVSVDIVPAICLENNTPSFELSATLIGDIGNGTGVWSGIGIIDSLLGTFDPVLAGVGMPTVTYTYSEDNCIYSGSSLIAINEQPTATFTLVDSICIDESSTITYTGTASSSANFAWDFNSGDATPGAGIGPHEVSWMSAGTQAISLTVTENGCISTEEIQMVEVDAPLSPPVISCETDNTSITFSWDPIPGAMSYQVVDVTGPAGTLADTSYSITGLTPGDIVTIQVIAVTDAPCGNVMSEQTCVAQDCPDITINITEILPLCEDDEPVSLVASTVGGDSTGTFTWSGTGVTGAIFDPASVPQADDYTISVEYIEGVCVYNASTTITVNAVPSSDFIAIGPVCEDSITTITYTGSAGPMANYSWNFDGAMADPGTGQGPHNVSWFDAGTKTISLTVEENGCTSESTTQIVEVDARLATPVISCESTSTSVLFSWDPILGATEYQVISSVMGTLNGTTYLVDGLTPGDEINVQVIAVGTGTCGNSSATASCIAQDCPMLSATLSGPAAICNGDNTTLTIDIDATDAGPYTVVYSIGANEVTAEFPAGSSTFDVALTETVNISIVSITNTVLTDCIYSSMSSLNITVEQAQSAGSAIAIPQLCESVDSLINLSSLLTAADIGGVWTEGSNPPSTGGAFDAGAATFATTNQSEGTYSFIYTVGGGVCPESSVTVEVIIEPLPIANAGEDMELTCNMGMVTLGGNTSNGDIYNWIAADGTPINNPNDQFVDIGQPGIYQLTVSTAFGCTATDEVSVTANLDVPTFETIVSQISCFEAQDGSIQLTNFEGGQAPYQVSLNGGAFSSVADFFNLNASSYDILVQEANGCISEITLNLEEPEQVLVTLSTNLEGENVIQLGDSILLSAIYNPNLNIDTIIWQPDSIAFNSTSSSSVWVNPEVTSSFSVTIANENGCSDTDDALIIVEKNRPVYIPNIFSPNQDGRNDVFYIQGGDGIVEVKEFSIFNRWGEQIFFADGFQPNDPNIGWDGTCRGELMNPAVFVYYAEIEFIDGEVILFKGDVTLMR